MIYNVFGSRVWWDDRMEPSHLGEIIGTRKWVKGKKKPLPPGICFRGTDEQWANGLTQEDKTKPLQPLRICCVSEGFFVRILGEPITETTTDDDGYKFAWQEEAPAFDADGFPIFKKVVDGLFGTKDLRPAWTQNPGGLPTNSIQWMRVENDQYLIDQSQERSLHYSGISAGTDCYIMPWHDKASISSLGDRDYYLPPAYKCGIGWEVTLRNPGNYLQRVITNQSPSPDSIEGFPYNQVTLCAFENITFSRSTGLGSWCVKYGPPTVIGLREKDDPELTTTTFVRKFEFDEDSAFLVTPQEGIGTTPGDVKIKITDADETHKGIVTTEPQTFGGTKNIPDGVEAGGYTINAYDGHNIAYLTLPIDSPPAVTTLSSWNFPEDFGVDGSNTRIEICGKEAAGEPGVDSGGYIRFASTLGSGVPAIFLGNGDFTTATIGHTGDVNGLSFTSGFMTGGSIIFPDPPETIDGGTF